MKEILKRRKGITLIALVITIIILLILAAVSIGALAGNDGLFGKTKDAEKKWNLVQEKENNTLSEYVNEINKYLSDIPSKTKKAKIVDMEFDEEIGDYIKKYIEIEYEEGMTWLEYAESKYNEIFEYDNTNNHWKLNLYDSNGYEYIYMYVDDENDQFIGTINPTSEESMEAPINYQHTYTLTNEV